jgi:hypothetical protein
MDNPKINSMDDLTALLASQEKRISELEQANAALISEVKKRFVSKEALPQAVAASQPPRLPQTRLLRLGAAFHRPAHHQLRPRTGHLLPLQHCAQ